jgi:LysR family transcriptional regulator, transcriptional activator of nhaA
VQKGESMNGLNYHHLLYFRTIAVEGGIAKAARSLQLGQPTLSTQLKQFETFLGKELFERRNRSLVLTEAGKVTLEYANKIFSLGQELISVLEAETFSEKQQLRIGVLDSIPKSCVVSIASIATKQFRCSVSLLEGRSEELFKELFQHNLDLVLTNHTPSFDTLQKVVAKTVGVFPVSLFGTPKHAGLAQDFPQSLSGQGFVLPTHHSKLRHDLEHHFQRLKIAVDVAIETQDTALQKLLCIAGNGIIALPDFAGMELVQEEKLVKIGSLEGVHEEVWLVAGARQISNPVASWLLENFNI